MVCHKGRVKCTPGAVRKRTPKTITAKTSAAAQKGIVSFSLVLTLDLRATGATNTKMPCQPDLMESLKSRSNVQHEEDEAPLGRNPLFQRNTELTPIESNFPRTLQQTLRRTSLPTRMWLLRRLPPQLGGVPDAAIGLSQPSSHRHLPLPRNAK